MLLFTETAWDSAELNSIWADSYLMEIADSDGDGIPDELDAFPNDSSDSAR